MTKNEVKIEISVQGASAVKKSLQKVQKEVVKTAKTVKKESAKLNDSTKKIAEGFKDIGKGIKTLTAGPIKFLRKDLAKTKENFIALGKEIKGVRIKISNFVKKLTAKPLKFLKKDIEKTRKNFIALGKETKTVFKNIGKFIQKITDKPIILLKKGILKVSGVFKKLGSTIGTVSSNIGKFIGKITAGPIKFLRKDLAKTKENFSKLGLEIRTVSSRVWGVLTKVGSKIVSWGTTLVKGFSKIGSGIWKVFSGLGGVASKGIGAMKNIVSKGIGVVSNIFKTLGSTVLPALQHAFTAIAGPIGAVIGKVAGIAGMFALAIGGVTAAAAGFIAVIGIKGAAEMEQYRIAFTTLLGSTEAANKALNRIKEDAKKTPFDIPGLIQANRLLIGAGLEADRAQDLILSFGDALSALGLGNEVLTRMGVNLQQIKALGHATAIDMKQFAYAGIPIYDMLADSMGKTVKEIKEMDSTSITFEMIEKAFKDASAEGGRFYGAMEAQSQSFRGILERTKESIQMSTAEIMEQSGAFDFLKKALAGVETFITSFFEGFMTRLPGIQEAFGSLINSLGLLGNAIGISGETADGFAENFGMKAGGAVEKLIELIDGFVQGFTEHMPEIKGALSELGLAFGAFRTTGVEDTKEALDLLGVELDETGTAMDTTGIDAETLGMGLGTTVGGSITDMITGLTGLVTWITENKDTIYNFMNGVIGLAGAITPLIEKANELLGIKSKYNSTAWNAPSASILSTAMSRGFRSMRGRMGRQEGGLIHAQGGFVIPGNSNSGDKVPIMANSGEMIINKSQQGALFKLIQELVKRPQTINISGNTIGGQRGEAQTMDMFSNYLLKSI